MVSKLHFCNKSLLTNVTMVWHVCLSSVLLLDMCPHSGLCDLYATLLTIQYHMYSVHMVFQVHNSLEMFVTLFALEVTFLTSSSVVSKPLFRNACGVG